MKKESFLDNTETVLKMVYGALETKTNDNGVVEYVFMGRKRQQITLCTPKRFYDMGDPFEDRRLVITKGPYMDTIHNLYDKYAFFAGHTFGTFEKYIDERGVERREFSMVKDKGDATHVYREIIWKRPENSPELASQRKKNSHLYEYRYSCQMSDNAGMVGGVEIVVMPIVRGLEGIADDYFEQLHAREFAETLC